MDNTEFKAESNMANEPDIADDPKDKASDKASGGGGVIEAAIEGIVDILDAII